MLIETQAPVKRASGKQGEDIVFFSWRGAQCARDYARPTNPNTPAQRAFRNTLSILTKRWQTLTVNQRAQWATYASANKKANRLGIMTQSTSLGCYVAINATPVTAGTPITDAPPQTSAPSPPLTITKAYLSGTGLEVGFTHTAAVAGQRAIFFLYRPASEAVRLSQGAMRIGCFPSSAAIGTMTTGATTTEFELDNSALILVPVEGETLHVGVRILNSDGAISSMSIESVVVTAP